MARLWRFIHVLAHIFIGFGEPPWVTKFHDWSAKKWDKAEKKA